MTNTEIIIHEAIANGIYTEDEVDKILSMGYTLPIHTFQLWKSAGYAVKKGEHARITTRLWRFSNKSKKNNEEHPDADSDHYYLTKAFLFTAEQVEKIS